MTENRPSDELLSLEEVNEMLAEATGSTPKEIEEGAEAFDVAPPWGAEVVDED